MSNGMLNNMEFENRLQELGDNQPELIKFVARQLYVSSQLLAKHDVQITTLEQGDKKRSTIAGGLSGTIAGVIIGLINYFTSGNK